MIQHRSLPPISNPTYTYNYDDSFKGRQPGNVLEAKPSMGARTVDPRLTAEGTTPAVKLPAAVPYSYQTSYNVWALRPA
jgi:hypothetical protein